jgi:hypothetical protein
LNPSILEKRIPPYLFLKTSPKRIISCCTSDEGQFESHG